MSFFKKKNVTLTFVVAFVGCQARSHGSSFLP